MSNEIEHSISDVAKMAEGADAWNSWIKENPDTVVNFRGYTTTYPLAPNFDGFIFPRYAEFKNAEFKHRVTFRNCRFQTLNFPGAVFNSERKVVGDISFEGSVFFGPSHFDNRDFKNTTSFKNCVFHVAPTFHNTEFHQDTDFSGAKFHDIQSEGAERAYRTLKVAMSQHHAHAEEMMFFKLEMQAQRYKANGPEKALYWLYEVCSDYGQSVARPAFMLVGTFFIFLVWYWMIIFNGHLDKVATPSGADYIDKLYTFTLEHTVPFLLPVLKGPEKLPGINSAWTSTLVAAHTTIAIVLLFFLLLGIRNRFRLKG